MHKLAALRARSYLDLDVENFSISLRSPPFSPVGGGNRERGNAVLISTIISGLAFQSGESARRPTHPRPLKFMRPALTERRRVLFSLTRAYFFPRLKRRERKSSVAYSLIVFKFYLRASIFNFLLRLRAAGSRKLFAPNYLPFYRSVPSRN